MMIVISKRQLLLFGAFLFCVVLSILSLAPAYTTTFSAISSAPPLQIVIDPGHGGKDGGAVSESGITESSLNLSIAQRLNDLLSFLGNDTHMTRTSDRSIHTKGNTLREIKRSDLQNRVALVNHCQNACLVSIHQNSLPSSPVTHGAQVFWNRQKHADTLAACVQDSLNLSVNQGNEKSCKQISDSIYLMKQVQFPAILVECGFLSHEGETKLLQEPSYQIKLASAIAAGISQAVKEET